MMLVNWFISGDSFAVIVRFIMLLYVKMTSSNFTRTATNTRSSDYVAMSTSPTSNEDRVTPFLNYLIRCVHKAQSKGAFSLQESAEIYTTIIKFQREQEHWTHTHRQM